MYSGLLIFLAMIFDALDGYVARLSRTASDFGAELDSLCDLVTFGVAPAFLLVKMCPQFAYLHRDAVWVIAASFAACAALRLARFNVETSDEDEHLHFSGLPSPAAAAAIAGFAIMFYTLRSKEDNVLSFAETDRHCAAIRAAFLRRAGGAVDGVADSLSARGQPGVSRAAEFRPHRGGGFRLGGDHGRSAVIRCRSFAVRSCFTARCGCAGRKSWNGGVRKIRCFEMLNAQCSMSRFGV